MRSYLFLFLFISLFTACEKEEIEVTETTTTSEEVTVGLRGKIPIGPFPSGPAEVQSSVNDLNLCGTYLSGLEDITATSAWTVGNSSSLSYVDYVLEQAFQCSFQFSTCLVRLAGPPVNVYTADFLLTDNGYLTFDPIEGDVVMYDYLSDNITPSVAEELKDHFACEIKDYQNLYYPTNSYISNVDFSGDALLCTCPSGTSRFLRATVTFYLY